MTDAHALSPAFLLPDGGHFVGTATNAGPWDAGHMYFGPPAALLGRVITALPDEPARPIARLTFEVLRPVPVGPSWSTRTCTAARLRCRDRAAATAARVGPWVSGG